MSSVTQDRQAASAGPIVLVGHSYGGAVITNAATGDTQVKALVYVDAFAPDQGQSIGQLVSSVPGSCVAAADPGAGHLGEVRPARI